MTRKTSIIIAFIVITLVVGCIYYKNRPLTPEPSSELGVTATNDVINAANFICSDNKNIQAIFYRNHVELSLSDGRNIPLPQAMSASGARYANANESFVFWNKGTTGFITEGATTTFQNCAISSPEQPSNQLANPASVNCLKLGGNLVINKRGDGGEYGLCYFEDNRACEEWALLHGTCPYGGRKTTGFDTIDQNYCAWNGGDTTAVPNSVCTFKNGSTCLTIDFYNGNCSPDSVK